MNNKKKTKIAFRIIDSTFQQEGELPLKILLQFCKNRNRGELIKE